ncbi:MAG: DUF4158 domain-containing protein, partial [Streptosporangiales bacterium]|nr:DUF4158 domain-containing protein [Streptosporangiales bacterium]
CRFMPVDFLSDEQAAAYGRFTGVPSQAELEQFCFLDDADLALVAQRRCPRTVSARPARTRRSAASSSTPTASSSARATTRARESRTPRSTHSPPPPTRPPAQRRSSHSSRATSTAAPRHVTRRSSTPASPAY